MSDHECAHCGADGCTHGCGACKDVAYCSDICQANDWQHHAEFECVDGKLRQAWYWAQLKTSVGRKALIRKVMDGQLSQSQLIDLQGALGSSRKYRDLRAAVDLALRRV